MYLRTMHVNGLVGGPLLVEGMEHEPPPLKSGTGPYWHFNNGPGLGLLGNKIQHLAQ